MSTSQTNRALSTFADARGKLTVAEGESLPFPVERIYWIESMPAGVWRGAHAHKRLRQVVFAVRGRFKVVIQDGRGGKHSHEIAPGDNPIAIEPGWWRDFCALESDGILLVTASHRFDPDDYIRDWAEFEIWVSGQDTLEQS